MNPFPKNLVVAACEELIHEINTVRDEERLKATSGKKRFGWFGRVLTPEEAYAKLLPLKKLELEAHYGRQEGQAKKILAVATHCQGDSINLSAKEFDVIRTWYGTVTI